MADFCTCSACGADLRGPVIHPDVRHLYGAYEQCPHACKGEPHFSRLIGVYDRARDRTVAWQCPDCKHEEPRA